MAVGVKATAAAASPSLRMIVTWETKHAPGRDRVDNNPKKEKKRPVLLEKIPRATAAFQGLKAPVWEKLSRQKEKEMLI